MFSVFQGGSEGSCSGDSGGPLVVYEAIPGNAHHVQVGVLRGGIGECGDENFPDIYIRLEDHDVLSWINKIAFGTETFQSEQKTVSKTWTSKNILYIDEYGQKILYNGELKNGIPNGQGYGNYLDQDAFYNGTWRSGLPNGYGEKMDSLGNWYKGEWKDGYWSGKGLKIVNGTVYHLEPTR